jgi:hypothetical protein
MSGRPESLPGRRVRTQSDSLPHNVSPAPDVAVIVEVLSCLFMLSCCRMVKLTSCKYQCVDVGSTLNEVTAADCARHMRGTFL